MRDFFAMIPLLFCVHDELQLLCHFVLPPPSPIFTSQIDHRHNIPSSLPVNGGSIRKV